MLHFHKEHPHTVKLQVPLSLIGINEPDEMPDHILGYDRTGSHTFQIAASLNKEGILEKGYADVIKSIYEGGMDRAKGYFNCWAANEDGSELDIDARCMMPAQPW